MRDRSLDNGGEASAPKQSKRPERKRMRSGKMTDEEKDQKPEDLEEEQNSSQTQQQPDLAQPHQHDERHEDVSSLGEERATAQRPHVEALPSLLPIPQQLQQESQQQQSFDLVSFFMHQQQQRTAKARARTDNIAADRGTAPS
jgi:hypothetical protein